MVRPANKGGNIFYLIDMGSAVQDRGKWVKWEVKF